MVGIAVRLSGSMPVVQTVFSIARLEGGTEERQTSSKNTHLRLLPRLGMLDQLFGIGFQFIESVLTKARRKLLLVNR